MIIINMLKLIILVQIFQIASPDGVAALRQLLGHLRSELAQSTSTVAIKCFGR